MHGGMMQRYRDTAEALSAWMKAEEQGPDAGEVLEFMPE